MPASNPDKSAAAPHAGGEAITPSGLTALEAEIESLEGEGRRAMAERLLAARQLGDLSENAEYHIAKEDQAHLETRIKRLRERLRNAVVVEARSEGSELAFGGRAEIRDEHTGQVHTWTIVGPTEAKPAEGRVSAESPVGRALLGREPGETVEVDTPRGVRRYRLERLLPLT